MNLTVNSQHLATELHLLNKVVPQKPAIAILSHALLTANESLNLYATNLELSLQSSCHAHVDEPGEVALPVARLLSLVEQFTDADVSIAADKGSVTVKCGAFKSRLQAMSSKDFPKPPEVEGIADVLDSVALRQMIERTRYAINATSSKYILQGALLQMVGAQAVMVTTDSKRLAMATMNRSGSDRRVVIPMKALDMLIGESSGGDVEMTVGSKHLHFAQGGRLLTSRTIDGEFPKYDRIIPWDNDKDVAVQAGSLAGALRRIILVSEDNRATYFTLTPGKLELSSRSAEVGTADEVVNVEYDGSALKICVNGSYVLDFLNASSGGLVKLHLKDASTAMLLTDGEDHVAVVMLMKG